jgi:hypothetical protein
MSVALVVWDHHADVVEKLLGHEHGLREVSVPNGVQFAGQEYSETAESAARIVIAMSAEKAKTTFEKLISKSAHPLANRPERSGMPYRAPQRKKSSR